jgi:hypothetical protein
VDWHSRSQYATARHAPHFLHDASWLPQFAHRSSVSQDVVMTTDDDDDAPAGRRI